MKLEDELRSLQNQFAWTDFFSAPSRRRSDKATVELLLLKKQPIKLKIYQEKKHPLPHIHIDYGKEKHAASYSIDTGERLEGDLSDKYDRLVSAWLNTNRDKLLDIWDALQEGNQDDYERWIAELPGI